MTGPFTPRPRRKRPVRGALGCLALVVVLAVLTGAMRLFATRLDQRRFPWAYAESGRPTLVGTWAGTMTTGGGVRRGVYLDLRLKPLRFPSGTGRRRGRRAGGSGPYRSARSSKLEGEVRLCGGPREQRFTFTGNNEDDAASRFRLGLSPADSVPPDGLAPSHMRGRWDGRDALAMEADVHLRRGVSAISASDDPDTGRPATLALRRAGEAEYRALCARVPRRR